MQNLRKILHENGLRITPQRLEVLNTILQLKNHPTAEQIIASIQVKNPNIAVGTIYKTLETFVNCGLIKKVKTDDDFMRYDAITEMHHHLYSSKSERIEDYFDEELNRILTEYFSDNKILNFRIEDLKLQIIGRFTDDVDKQS